MNSVESNPVLIGIDWGTSSLRAYLLGARGEILDQLYSPEGIMQVPDKNFEAVLDRLLSPWAKTTPVIVSGMITSRNGWLETHYLPLPTGVDQLAGGLLPFSTEAGLQMYFVTGVKTNINGAPDVIRGEETQLVGAVDQGQTDGIFVMPGTHSKWVRVRDSCIDNFETYMSGEIYATLLKHTILGALVKESVFSEQGFLMGVRVGYDSGTQLLQRLFSARTLPLFGLIGEGEVADYLSGMLIGAEIKGATNGRVNEDPIIIVGSDDLSERYRIALEILDIKCQRATDHIVARGHFAIANAAGLLT